MIHCRFATGQATWVAIAVAITAIGCTSTPGEAPVTQASPSESDSGRSKQRIAERDGWDCAVDPLRLFDAALEDRSDRVSALLERCLTDSSLSRQDDVALQRAAYAGGLASVDLLLRRGADPNYQDADGETAITFGARPLGDFPGRGQDQRKARMVRRLIRAGADVNQPRGDRLAALHFAATGGFIETTAVLLRAGATVDARTNEGITPMMIAAAQGYGRVVSQLLKAGADPRRRDEDGLNAADKAREAGHGGIARRLRH